MAAVMFFSFENVTRRISSAYVTRYAVSSAEALSAHIQKEISLMSLVANSYDVLAWLTDEFDEHKRNRAFDVFSGTVGHLYSYNMYIGLEDSLNEYRASTMDAVRSIDPVAVLRADDPMDAWYFECISSDTKYVMTVDIDHIMHRKRVWLNYRVEQDGIPLGVICTGLEFSHIVGEIFSQYENNNMRGIIIDRNGTIHMDSSLMADNEFLYNEYSENLRDVFTDTAIINAIETHLFETDGYWEGTVEAGVYNLTSGFYHYMTVAPIRLTDWTIIILSDTTTLFDTTYFIPIMLTIIALLVAFAATSSLVSYKIFFKPLRNLDDSLTKLNEHASGEIFGAERDDELGHLSNTIQDLFNKANVDPLTGLYNRRFMDSSMERVMGLLSRTDGQLSVLMLDIDFFKKYNDTYGHGPGDKCLQSVAHALSYTVSRVNDIVVRYGGEEFVIILPNTNSDGARKFAERLLKNVRELGIPHEKNDAAAYVTVSIGVTTGKVDHRQDLGMYIKRADEALYKSKENGRDRYTYLDF